MDISWRSAGVVPGFFQDSQKFPTAKLWFDLISERNTGCLILQPVGCLSHILFTLGQVHLLNSFL